jgi:hypothetical protein
VLHREILMWRCQAEHDRAIARAGSELPLAALPYST